MSKPFAGVPAGRVQVTPLPNVLFSEVLPEIDDLAEAQVTLHVFYLLYQKKGSPRFVTLDELRADTTLRRALAQNGQPVEEILTRGLKKAEARGTLLHLVIGGEDSYFFNTAESRAAIARIEHGELLPDTHVRRIEPAAEEPPNIFKLYEQHIGALTPLIAEELKEAEQEYPPEVILDAFRIAAENNVRKWSYVRAILSDGTREGKHEARGRDTKGSKGPRRGKRKPHFQGEFIERVKRQHQ
jgi:DNA replication protein